MSRRQDIIDVAVAQFYERGYNGTSLRDIADALGIKVPSLYNHISSKNDLLRQIMSDGMDLLESEFESAVKDVDDLIERVSVGVQAHVRHHALHRVEALVNNYEVAHLDPEDRARVLARRRAYTRNWER